MNFSIDGKVRTSHPVPCLTGVLDERLAITKTIPYDDWVWDPADDTLTNRSSNPGAPV